MDLKMMVPGLVSVILPNRNHGHFLPRALDGLLVQSYRHTEILVIDDASSDNSREVVGDYLARDARLQLLELTKHHGINQAVAATLPRIRGEYLYLAAADDLVAPSLLEKLVAQLDQHKGAGLCFSDPTEFQESGRVVAFPLYLSDVPVFYEPAHIVSIFQRNYFHISSNATLYRTVHFRAAGGFRPELDRFSDWFVTYILALRHGACYVPEQLTSLTVRSDSYSAISARDRKANRRLFERLLDVLSRPEYGDVFSRMREARLLPAYNPQILFWLIRSKVGRKVLTPNLIVRVLGRSLWAAFRPIAPIRLRRSLRKMSNAPSR